MDEEIGEKKVTIASHVMFFFVFGGPVGSIHAYIFARRYYGVWSSQLFKILEHLSEDPLGFFLGTKTKHGQVVGSLKMHISFFIDQ